MTTKFILNDEIFDCLDSDFIPEGDMLLYTYDLTRPEYKIREIRHTLQRDGDNANVTQLIYLEDTDGHNKS